MKDTLTIVGTWAAIIAGAVMLARADMLGDFVSAALNVGGLVILACVTWSAFRSRSRSHRPAFYKKLGEPSGYRYEDIDYSDGDQ